MKRRSTWISIGIIAGLAAAYTFWQFSRPGEPSNPDSPLAREISGLTTAKKDVRLQRDLRTVAALTDALEAMAAEMAVLREAIDGEKRGYFTSDEHDLIESLLFRYIGTRETLWELLDCHRQYDTLFDTPEQRAKSFTIGFASASRLYDYGSQLVHAFLDSPLVIAKLNEPDPRWDIPAGVYDNIFERVTKPEHLRALGAAWQLFLEEMDNPDSALSRLARESPAYAEQLASITGKHEALTARVEDILERRSLLLPGLRNALRHSEINQLAQAAQDASEDTLYAIRGLVFLKVSRLKKPGTPPVELSPQQISEFRSLLEPGDILLTFSEGYMSNLFLPGAFKHGITYVGTPEDRAGAGIAPLLQTRPAPLRESAEAGLTGGTEEELVEALAEGVIFNSLDHLLTTRMNRLVVWRPRFTPEQRAENLADLFAYLGQEYDFKFDFNESAYQCCTEVIYRALNTVGDVELPLTERMGRQTLSADDLCNYALEHTGEMFDFVALVLPDEARGKRAAQVMTGDDGLEALRALMQE